MSTEHQILLAIILLINIIGSILVIVDKKRAKKGAFRIRERTFFLFAVFGGSVGVYLTMIKIRHKTKHKRFMIGLPLIMILQAAAIVACLLKFMP